MNTYSRGQNDRRWGVVELRDVEGLGDQVGWVKLVKLNVARGLHGRGLRRGHVVRLGHAHSTKLLCHFSNSRGRLRIAGGGGLHHARIGTVHRLLIFHGLLGISPVGTAGRGLTPEGGIGAGSEAKGLTGVRSLLAASGGRRRRTLCGDLRLLRGIGGAVGRLAIPFLWRVTPLWSCHEGVVGWRYQGKGSSMRRGSEATNSRSRVDVWGGGLWSRGTAFLNPTITQSVINGPGQGRSAPKQSNSDPSKNREQSYRQDGGRGEVERR